MCTKFDLIVSLLLIERAGIQNYPIFRITPSYLTCGFTYSVSRATAWQSVDAVCLCCLTRGSCHWSQISSGYSNGGYQ